MPQTWTRAQAGVDVGAGDLAQVVAAGGLLVDEWPDSSEVDIQCVQGGTPIAWRGFSPNTTYTLAELVDDPCLVLNEDDTAVVGPFIEQPTEFAGGKQCLWVSAAGGVTFIPHPSADLTADPANQQRMTTTEVSGHRALLGVLIKDGGCAMYVAYGNGPRSRWANRETPKTGRSQAPFVLISR